MPDITRRHTLAAAAAIAATPIGGAAAQQAAPPATAPADPPLFGAKIWTLPNGLTVALAESRRAPVVAQYLYYAAGGGEDPAGRSGVAHFLEHMMFKGSPNVESGAFSRRVGREGGNDNAFTSRDVTAYHQQVEASRLPMNAAWPTNNSLAGRNNSSSTAWAGARMYTYWNPLTSPLPKTSSSRRTR